MFTRAAHGLLVVATSLLVLGLGTVNLLLVTLSAIPFTAALLGLAEPLPRLQQARIAAPEQVRAGDVFDITVELELREEGLVAASVPLPDAFDLVDGTNARIVEVDQHDPASWRFKVRAAKRGRYELGPVEAAPVPRLGLRAKRPLQAGNNIELEVHPGVVPLRRLRRMRGTAVSLGAEEDAARIGLKTTDFREIREYRFGDPPRAVNWKATARLGPAADAPLVNEYEIEGRQAVWFLLDAGRHMTVGTTIENGFELAVAAASGLSLAFLDRGYSVGMYAYNAAESEPVYPDVGDKQFYKLQRHLAGLAPGEGEEGPLQAVLASHHWSSQRSTMVVLLTRTDEATDELERAVRRLLTSGSGSRPVVVIEPLAHHLVATDETARTAARLLDHARASHRARLRRLGATVIPWNPRSTPLETLLFTDVVPHG